MQSALVQKSICTMLRAYSDRDRDRNFKYAYFKGVFYIRTYGILDEGPPLRTPLFIPPAVAAVWQGITDDCQRVPEAGLLEIS